MEKILERICNDFDKFQMAYEKTIMTNDMFSISLLLDLNNGYRVKYTIDYCVEGAIFISTALLCIKYHSFSLYEYLNKLNGTYLWNKFVINQNNVFIVSAMQRNITLDNVMEKLIFLLQITNKNIEEISPELFDVIEKQF